VHLVAKSHKFTQEIIALLVSRAWMADNGQAANPANL
jgi:hypothetical protein